MDLDTDIQYLKGVGEKRAALLRRVGIADIRALFEYYPASYEDWTDITRIHDAPLDTNICVRATVLYAPQEVPTRQRRMWKTQAGDGGGLVTLIFFSDYVTRSLALDTEYLFYGRLSADANGGVVMWSPKFEPADRGPALHPVYRLTAGLTSTLISSLVETALGQMSGRIEDELPSELVSHYRLPDRETALRQIHLPSGRDDVASARRRLVYEELFILMLGIGMEQGRNCVDTDIVINNDLSGEFASRLPFPMTGAQKRAVAECMTDLRSGRAMKRLLQGDVGSGKTAVAAALIYSVCRGGWQCAVLAPTEVLAQQHFETFKKFFSGSGITVDCLTGSMTAAQKKQTRRAAAAGETDLLIGTHALLTDGTSFDRLGLVVTDEQHRFGVAQRAALLAKGRRPHSLVMSATPIPRTLGLIIYGDLDISVLDELPAGRQKIQTYAVDSSYSQRALAFIADNARAGRQSYIVCPAVDEGEENRIPAKELYDSLRGGVFRDFSVGLLHGRMRPSEKESVMAAFRSGKIQILVCTVVIEVGVDVPNATIMLIENADLFGLSQLHQLRGRVGRGTARSYCILMSSTDSDTALERLDVLKNNSDGFAIADEDLRLRGPGEFFGRRQSGLPKLRLADLLTDMNVLTAARADARAILTEDPGLTDPAHDTLCGEVKRMFESGEGSPQ